MPQVHPVHQELCSPLWDPINKKAVFWVRTNVLGNNRTQAIYLVWGDAGAVASRSNGAEVFRTDQGFASVWHLDETAGTTVIDHTINHRNSYVSDLTIPGQADGLCGKSTLFFPNDDHVDRVAFASIDPDPLRFTTTFTVEAWFWKFPGSTNEWSHILGRKLVSNSDSWFLAIRNYNSKQYAYFNAGGNTFNPNSAITDNQWHHIVGVKSGTTISLYIDGALVQRITNALPEVPSDVNVVSIGGKADGTQAWANPFRGIIDEVRPSSVVRSDNWIKLEYQNYKQSQTLVQFPADQQGYTSKVVYVDNMVYEYNAGTGAMYLA
jgi:hypothetical protein